MGPNSRVGNSADTLSPLTLDTVPNVSTLQRNMAQQTGAMTALVLRLRRAPNHSKLRMELAGGQRCPSGVMSLATTKRREATVAAVHSSSTVEERPQDLVKSST